MVQSKRREMKKQFVSYKIALALKELGFDKKCLYAWCQVKGGYAERGGGKWLDEYKMRASGNPFGEFSEGGDYNNITGNNKNRIQCSAPLWQQVIDWFREKHGILISVDAVRYRGGNLEWGYFISIRNNGGYIITGFEHKGIENPEKIPYYHSYEEAREAAILEAIKLLKEENK